MYFKNLFNCLLATGIAVQVAAQEAPALGQAVSDEEIAAISLNVIPNGHGLPSGSGTANSGAKIYEAQCANCHGENGVGGTMIPMQGKPERGTDWSVGTVYPYATSIFDYVRRGMPPFNPKQLSNDDVYAVTAYILYLNGVIRIDEAMDRETLPQTKMPALEYTSSKWERVEKYDYE